MLLLGRYQMRLISLLCHLWLLTWWKMNKDIYRCMLSLWSVWLIRIGNLDAAYAISSLPKIWSMEIFLTQLYNKIICKDTSSWFQLLQKKKKMGGWVVVWTRGTNWWFKDIQLPRSILCLRMARGAVSKLNKKWGFFSCSTTKE